eukprot:1115515-Prymnesium_polylepis.9
MSTNTQICRALDRVQLSSWRTFCGYVGCVAPAPVSAAAASAASRTSSSPSPFDASRAPTAESLFTLFEDGTTFFRATVPFTVLVSKAAIVGSLVKPCRWTLGKCAFGKCTFGKCTFGKCTFGECTFGKCTWLATFGTSSGL